jgi:hypothetical protein
MNDTLFRCYREDQERIDDLRSLLRISGRRIGEGECGSIYYVLDGKVYLDRSTTQLEYSGDYFDFCRLLRRGNLPWFKPLGSFHLKGR